MAKSKTTKLFTAARRARQQAAVVEFHEDQREWWVMLPNGRVTVCDDSGAALREIKRAARSGNRGVTITTVEWRGVPAGFVPPVA